MYLLWQRVAAKMLATATAAVVTLASWAVQQQIQYNSTTTKKTISIFVVMYENMKQLQ
jgi:hypothetical protein